MAKTTATSGNNWQQAHSLPSVCLMPGKPFRSILEPHFEMLQRLRRARKTWREIAEILEKEKGLKIHYTAIQKFFSRRVHRKLPLGFESLPSLISGEPRLDDPSKLTKLTDEELQRQLDETHQPATTQIQFKDPFQP